MRYGTILKEYVPVLADGGRFRICEEQHESPTAPRSGWVRDTETPR